MKGKKTDKTFVQKKINDADHKLPKKTSYPDNRKKIKKTTRKRKSTKTEKKLKKTEKS
jgi:hypothetical protein